MDYFKNLYKEHKQFALIEWTYAILTVATLLIVGLVNLINPSVGAGLLIIPLVCFIAFAMNLVAWSLIKTFLDYLDARTAKPSQPAEKTDKADKAKSSKK